MNLDKVIRLRKGKAGRTRPGHPWIFRGQIAKMTTSVKPGDIVTVITNENDIVGRGYFNPASEISVRLLTFDDAAIDAAFIDAKVKDAVEKREPLKSVTNAVRLIYSEADSLPGLILDLYKDTAVIQIFTLGMEKLKPLILEAVKKIVKPARIYERSDSVFRKAEKLRPVKGWLSDNMPTNIEINEGGARFLVDIENGHKTGFYLDQRRSRLALKAVSKGKKVLDLFCYTGGFLVNAALGGAVRVTGVDIKQEWLDTARENAALNGVGDKAEFICGDAFKVTQDIVSSGAKFDIVIVDPPSFLRSKKDIVMAARGYKEINTLAFKALAPGGVLCTFSCSHNMPNDIFSRIVKDAAKLAGRTFTILKRCHQDKDHPIIKSIPETEYLKGYFLKAD
jgi:23S rRNA (cytosine1962-C5)-methyltransferase